MPGDSHRRGGRRKVLLVVAILYGVAGVAALLAIPASAFGWAGVEPDPLSAVFALLLALPWTIALYLLGDVGTWGSLAFCTAAIALNFFLLLRFARSRS